MSIFTGQADWHIESPAQVVIPSYAKSAASASASSRSARSAEARRRVISRVTTMRWRGVSVRSREGQRGSQKPHSVQRSASGEIVGQGFRLRRCARGSSFSRTPGLRMPSGSSARLTRCITPYARSPHSVFTNGAMLRPEPCSALIAPSYLFTTSSTRPRMKAS